MATDSPEAATGPAGRRSITGLVGRRSTAGPVGRRSVTGVLARVGVIVASVLTAALMPGIAYADVPLSSGAVVLGTQSQVYTFSTSTYYWSIVAVQPASNADFDLSLLPASGSTPYATSILGTGATDFVAINSNSGFQPFAGYRASVTKFGGADSYAVQQIQGSHIINLPIPANDGVSGPSDPDITFAILPDDQVVSISDIYLTAGQQFWSHTTVAGNSLYLLESNPSVSSTFFRSRSQASSASHSIVDGCTLYTATYTGWHALAVVADRMPTQPGAGIAYALHRFNPAKPTTCPVKNFPAPTPA